MAVFSWLVRLIVLLQFAAIILGLWVAGRLLPALMAEVEHPHLRALLVHPLARLAAWVALGTLFTFPLMDLLGWLRDLIQMSALYPGQVTTAFGTVSPQLYGLFNALLLFVVYATALVYSQEYWSEPSAFGRLGRFFFILSAASLVYRGVQAAVSQIFYIPVAMLNAQRDYGSVGFLIEALIALLMLGVILFILNRVLPTHPLSGEQ